MSQMPPIHVLLVEDNPTDVLLARESLSSVPRILLAHAERLAQAIQLLEHKPTDVVLLDLGLPDSQGLATLRRLREKAPQCAFVVFTGSDDEALGLEAVQAGAQDYLVKSQIIGMDLGRSVLYAIERNQIKEKLRKSEEQFRLMATLATLSADIGIALTRPGSLQELLQACAEAIVRCLRAAFARIWIVHPDESVLVLQASAGQYTHLNGAHSRIPVGKLKIGRIALDRRPHRTNDVFNDPLISSPEWARREGMIGFAGFPLVVNDKLLGVIGIFARQPFSEETLKSMEAVASHIAMGIDRKQAEASLFSTQERLKRVLASSPVILYNLKLEGTKIVAAWNSENIQSLLDYDHADTCRAEWWLENIHPDDRSIALARIEGLAEHGHLTCEYRFRHSDGSYRWIRDETRLVRDAGGQPNECVGSWNDITLQKQAEESLRASEQRFRQMADVAPTIIWITDPTGACTFLNKQWCNLTGQPMEQGLGMGWLDTVHVNDRAAVASRWQAAEQKQSEYRSEYRIRRHDDHYRWVLASGKPRFGPEGEFLGYIGSITDLTEHKSLEEQLRQSQKMDAFGQLAGGVAHDFNNLLTIISGYSDLLLSNPMPEDATRECLKGISDAGQRAASLTRQLLAFSRQTVLEPRILDLNQIVRETEKMLRRLIGEDIVLTTVLDPSLRRVRIDPSQIGQVLMNLAINARDAMPKGGSLTIETRNVELDQEYSGTHVEARPGQFIMLAVSDSGCGIAPEIKARIFEPFFTTKGVGKGTGLGLAVVHGIVKQSEGHIEVYSEVNIGTAFKIYLPVVDEQAAANKPTHGSDQTMRGSESVLLVEDEAGVRRLAQLVLQAQGYTVHAANDGKDAVRIAVDSKLPFDLLVTDVVMPGMDGRDVAQAIGAIFPKIKVLYLSGYTDDAIVRHGILHEEVAFLQKPFTPYVLTKKVREVLDKQP